jgi:dihydrofolate reductase
VGKIVVSEFLSLDGVMEAPGGESGYRHTGWVMRFPDPAQYAYKLKEVLEHEALLIGRRTYEAFAGAWPARDGEFADKMNSMPKYVASTTLERAEWNNSTVLQGDVAAAVAKLKEQLSGDILVAGSRTLVNTLEQHDLIDEYRLMFFPIVLGSGMRLFDDAFDATTLTLVDMQRFESGTVVLTYRTSRAIDEGRS